MSRTVRTVDIIVTVDPDLIGTVGIPALGPFACVVGVHPARWNHVPDEVTEPEVERAVSHVLDGLGRWLADVTGEDDDRDDVQRAADELAHARLEAMSAAQRVGRAEQAYAAALRAGGVGRR